MTTQAAEKLVRWRKKRGLSQTALAEELGVAQGTVSEWEGGRKMPRTQHVLAIAKLTRNAVPLADWLAPVGSAHA